MKRWNMSRHCVAVKPREDTGSECGNAAGALAPVGLLPLTLRPAHRAERNVVLLAVAAAMIPAIAHSSPAARSVSSGSVQISVSVAPRYKVLAVEAPDAARDRPERYFDRLCLATNSSVPPMPVMLVRPSTHRLDVGEAGLDEDGQLADGTSTGVWRCSLMNDRSASEAPNPADRAPGRWLLVRSE